MQLHELKPKHKLKRKKRVGRGGKRGTYSGRGIKGQRSRSGKAPRPEIRDFVKKIKKKRGYKFKPSKEKPRIFNLKDLEKYFNSGEKITPQTLLEKGLISTIKGKIPEVKILGKGKLNKKIEIEGCKMSRSVEKLFKNPEKQRQKIKTKKPSVAPKPIKKK